MAPLAEGLRNRWIDVYESEGKTTVAYSGGSYITYPFILLNYRGGWADVFTLAHELGHAMHSYFTRRTQPYIYGNCSPFVAEVAATLNETMLTDYLLRHAGDPLLRRRVVDQELERLRGVLFRQTMFAEFEFEIHSRSENGEVLTPELLSDLCMQLNVKHNGPEVHPDEEIATEWASIPHFYSAYCVYQYATGVSSAVALARQILSEGESAAHRYMQFLKSGSSNYPVDLLKETGVDITSPEPVERALDRFGELLDQMEKLSTGCEASEGADRMGAL